MNIPSFHVSKLLCSLYIPVDIGCLPKSGSLLIDNVSDPMVWRLRAAAVVNLFLVVFRHIEERRYFQYQPDSALDGARDKSVLLVLRRVQEGDIRMKRA